MRISADMTLRPAGDAGDKTCHGEVFVLAMLLLLTGLLLRPWIDSGMAYSTLVNPDTNAEEVSYVNGFLRDAMNPWLLPALGLTWVLHRRSADLSVWVAFACGSAAAAAVIGGGGHPLVALAATLGVGLAFGLAHAAAAATKLLPAWPVAIVTIVTALIARAALTAATGGQAQAIDTDAMIRWTASENPNVVTGGLFAAAVLLGMLASRHDPGPSGRSLALSAAMAASGVLAAMGGLCWLVRYGRTPLPTMLVGDLRVVAAAMLAGAICMRGRGRGLLAAVMLPGAMLVTTMWRQLVLPGLAFPLAWNLLILSAMAVGAQWAFRAAMLSGRGTAVIWPALAGLGMLTLAATSRGPAAALPTVRIAIASTLWLAGVTGAGVIAWRAGAPKRHPEE